MLVDNPYLRVFGYASRVGRLVGTYASAGSRYLGYASDVGEAFRPVMDVRYVRAGYAISWAYVLLDVGLNTKKAKDAGEDWKRAGLHSAVFQSLGTMLAPAVIIHTVVHQSERALHAMKRTSRFGPTAMGLAVVPFLPYIADPPVEIAVDWVFDKVWPVPGGGHGHRSAPASAVTSTVSEKANSTDGGKAKVE